MIQNFFIVRIIKTISLFIFLLLFGQTIVNCSKSHDNSSKEDAITQDDILGKWYSDSKNQDNINLEFLSSDTVNFTYIGAGNKGEDITEKGKWSISDNNLNIRFLDADPGMEKWKAKILILNSEQLKYNECVEGKCYIFNFHR